jgi:hypothetical protein
VEEFLAKKSQLLLASILVEYHPLKSFEGNLYSQFTEGFQTPDLLEAKNLLGNTCNHAAVLKGPDGSTA